MNAVSKFDAYPISWVDKLLDRLGTARFYIGFYIGRSPYRPYPKNRQLPQCRLNYTNLLSFLQFVRSTGHFSGSHGQNLPSAHCLCRCLSGTGDSRIIQMGGHRGEPITSQGGPMGNQKIQLETNVALENIAGIVHPKNKILS